MSTDFWLGVGIILLVVVFIELLILIGLQVIEHTQDREPIRAVCSKLYIRGFWYYDGAYVRDMTYGERLKWCPKDA